METREVTIEDLGDLPPLTLVNFTQGLPFWLTDWFLHSNEPKAVENRRTVRARLAWETDQANQRQAKRREVMKEEAKYIDPKSPIRPIASIDSVIAQDFRNRYGSGCWNDRAFIEDCRNKAPELFYPKVKRPFIGWSKTLENLQAITASIAQKPHRPLMLEWKK